MGYLKIKKTQLFGGLLALSLKEYDTTSEKEVFGTTKYSGGIGENNRYPYYANGISTIKNYEGSATEWWLCSPYIIVSGHISVVNKDGSISPSGQRSQKSNGFLLMGVHFSI